MIDEIFDSLLLLKNSMGNIRINKVATFFTITDKIETNVTELMQTLKMNQPGVFRHVHTLKRLGLVTSHNAKGNGRGFVIKPASKGTELSNTIKKELNNKPIIPALEILMTQNKEMPLNHALVLFCLAKEPNTIYEISKSTQINLRTIYGCMETLEQKLLIDTFMTDHSKTKMIHLSNSTRLPTTYNLL